VKKKIIFIAFIDTMLNLFLLLINFFLRFSRTLTELIYNACTALNANFFVFSYFIKIAFKQ